MCLPRSMNGSMKTVPSMRNLWLTLSQEISPRADLHAYDAFAEEVAALVEMPDRTLDLLHRFLRQNGGTLSRRARQGEFAALTDAEVERIEAAYARTTGVLPPAPGEGMVVAVDR